MQYEILIWMQDYAEYSNVMLFCNWLLVDGIQHRPGIVLGIKLLTLKQMNKMNQYIYLLIYFLLFAMVIKANGFMLV